MLKYIKLNDQNLHHRFVCIILNEEDKSFNK